MCIYNVNCIEKIKEKKKKGKMGWVSVVAVRVNVGTLVGAVVTWQLYHTHTHTHIVVTDNILNSYHYKINMKYSAYGMQLGPKLKLDRKYT